VYSVRLHPCALGSHRAGFRDICIGASGNPGGGANG
jgi:hypothetical protein